MENLTKTQLHTSLIKHLRDKTGAGVTDCRNALNESNGDIESAIDILRVRGLAGAVKKTNRSTSCGMLVIYPDASGFSVCQLLCETDFVSRSDKFKDCAKSICKSFFSFDGSRDSFLKSPYSGFDTFNDYVKSLISIFGENINIGKMFCENIDNTNLHYSYYIHNKIDQFCGETISVISYSINNNLSHNQAENLAHNLCMHIVASQPLVLKRVDLEESVIERALNVAKLSAERDEKPNHITEKIIQGKMSNFYKKHVLLEQDFVMDTSISCHDLIKKFNKENNCLFSLNKFYLYQA